MRNSDNLCFSNIKYKFSVPFKPENFTRHQQFIFCIWSWSLEGHWTTTFWKLNKVFWWVESIDINKQNAHRITHPPTMQGIDTYATVAAIFMRNLDNLCFSNIKKNKFSVPFKPENFTLHQLSIFAYMELEFRTTWNNKILKTEPKSSDGWSP
jgi:hypothetical protein